MKNLIVANWKMHKTRAEAKDFAEKLKKSLANTPLTEKEVVIIPPFTAIETVATVFADTKNISVGAQNIYPAQNGAFTGEISSVMLADIGVNFILAGHSERRQICKESDEFINEKVLFALKEKFRVILCIGESKEERDANKISEVLFRQLEKGLVGVEESDLLALVLAYEPVWAIGTGAVASEKEIKETHEIIRKKIVAIFGEKGHTVQILYGGSVKADNCSSLLAVANVNGVLVGGASLDADSFRDIILA